MSEIVNADLLHAGALAGGIALMIQIAFSEIEKSLRGLVVNQTVSIVPDLSQQKPRDSNDTL